MDWLSLFEINFLVPETFDFKAFKLAFGDYIDQFDIIPVFIVLTTLYLTNFIIYMSINILPHDYNAMILVIFIIILILF